MQKKINNVEVNYEFLDNHQNTTLIFLHGWGQNIAMMEPVSKYYTKYFNILILDLPGFGKSSEPDFAWDTLDYVNFLKDFITALKLKHIILIGHSFGGRIALLYASLYQVDKLICLASPYCPEIKKLPFKNRLYKKIKNVPGLKRLAQKMKNKISSPDYQKASPIMQGVLVKAVNTDLSRDVLNIKAPTLLIWGDQDTAVPLNRAYELEKLIKDAGVIVFKNATHYAYLERLPELIRILDNFLKVVR